MITIDIKFKKDIDAIREYIIASQNVSDFFIKKLGERIGLKTFEEKEILWDHIVNNYSFMVNYKSTKKIKCPCLNNIARLKQRQKRTDTNNSNCSYIDKQ